MKGVGETKIAGEDTLSKNYQSLFRRVVTKVSACLRWQRKHLNVIEELSIPLNPYNCVLMLGSMWSSSLEISMLLTRCLAFKRDDFL